MKKEELVELAKSLKYSLETLREREKDIHEKLANYFSKGDDNVSEIIETLKERDYYKKLFEKERDRNMHQKIVLGSQNRILQSKVK